MLIALVIATSAPLLPVKAADLLERGFQIPMNLFYLAQLPSGTMFCEKARKLRQTRKFDKRYGIRFNKLIEVVREREGLGWPPDQVITTPCYRSSQKSAEAMLDDFELDLGAYEVRYGLDVSVR